MDIDCRWRRRRLLWFECLGHMFVADDVVEGCEVEVQGEALARHGLILILRVATARVLFGRHRDT